jgi:hypothetical protein
MGHKWIQLVQPHQAAPAPAAAAPGWWRHDRRPRRRRVVTRLVVVAQVEFERHFLKPGLIFKCRV